MEDLRGLFPKYSPIGYKAPEILKFDPYNNLKFNDQGYEDDNFKRNLLFDIFPDEIFFKEKPSYLDDVLYHGKMDKYLDLNGSYIFHDEEGHSYAESYYEVFYIYGVILLKYGSYNVFSNCEQIRIFNQDDLAPKSSRNWARVFLSYGEKDIIIGPIPENITNKSNYVRRKIIDSGYNYSPFISLYKSFENAKKSGANKFRIIDTSIYEIKFK